MKQFWNVLATLLKRYAIFGAGLPSVHGLHELPVPTELKK